MTRSIRVISLILAVGCDRKPAPASVPLPSATADSTTPASAYDPDTAFRMPDTTMWAKFESPRWGFSFRHPPGTRVRVRGPASRECTPLARRGFDPPYESLVSDGSPGDSVPEILVSFTSAPFDSIAGAFGFIRHADNAGWYLDGGDGEAQKPVRVTTDRILLSGSRFQRVYGEEDGDSAVEQADLSLLVLRRADGCMLVMRHSQLGAKGAELETETMLRTVVWSR